MVIATQNPIDMEGTYPLPEAQRDRFMARIAMGYPSATAEMDMLNAHAGAEPLEQVVPVADASQLSHLVESVRAVHVSAPIRRYAVDLVAATRTSPDLRLGASPRATLHLVRASKAAAALAGRDHVLPDDLKALAVPVLAHRLLLTAEAAVARRTPEAIVTDLLTRVPVST